MRRRGRQPSSPKGGTRRGLPSSICPSTKGLCLQCWEPGADRKPPSAARQVPEPPISWTDSSKAQSQELAWYRAQPSKISKILPGARGARLWGYPPLLQMGNPRLRRAKLLGQGLPASKEQTWDSNPGPPGTRVFNYSSQLTWSGYKPSGLQRVEGPFWRQEWATMPSPSP